MIGSNSWTSGVRSISIGRWLPAYLVSRYAIWSSATACRQCAGLAILVTLAADCVSSTLAYCSCKGPDPTAVELTCF